MTQRERPKERRRVPAPPVDAHGGDLRLRELLSRIDSVRRLEHDATAAPQGETYPSRPTVPTAC